MAAILDRAENILDGFGLMTGDYAPAKRFLVGSLLGGVLITWLKPSYAINPSTGYPNIYGIATALAGGVLLGVLI